MKLIFPDRERAFLGNNNIERLRMLDEAKIFNTKQVTEYQLANEILRAKRKLKSEI